MSSRFRVRRGNALTNVSTALRSASDHRHPFVLPFFANCVATRQLFVRYRFKHRSRLVFFCRNGLLIICPGETQDTSSALHAKAGSVLDLSISGPYELYFKVVVQQGPGLTTSTAHYSVQFAKQVSPLDPASPTVRAPLSVPMSALLLGATTVASESVTKSIAFGPPTVFEGASFYTDLGPAHFSGATEDVFEQQESGPMTRH